MKVSLPALQALPGSPLPLLHFPKLLSITFQSIFYFYRWERPDLPFLREELEEGEAKF